MDVPMPVNATLDPEAGALYIALRDQTVARTIEIDDTFLADVDAEGDVVGFELLGPSAIMRLPEVAERFDVASVLPEIVAAAASAATSASTLAPRLHLIYTSTSLGGIPIASGSAAHVSSLQVRGRPVSELEPA
jgi:uncharacterized protein YuzE